MTREVPVIGHEVVLLRMVWHPVHFPNGELIASAFESSDLRPDRDRDDRPRYISVDRQDDLRKQSIDWRIAYQQRDGRDEQENRKEVRFIEFLCGEILTATDDSGTQPFAVTTEPVLAMENGMPENPGHCAIRNVSGKGGDKKKAEDRTYVEELRTILMRLKRRITNYEDVFPEKAD